MVTAVALGAKQSSNGVHPFSRVHLGKVPAEKRRQRRVKIVAMTSSQRDLRESFSSSAKNGLIACSSVVSTDVPMYDSPEVSFDEYLTDKQRVMRAIFPDQLRMTRLNKEEWKIEMVPIEFLFISANIAVVMQWRTQPKQGRHKHYSSWINFESTRWEINGLEGPARPTQFSLHVKGNLYTDRSGPAGSRVKAEVEMHVSLGSPPILALVPENTIRAGANMIMKIKEEEVKHNLSVGLITDFRRYRKERLRKQQILAKKQS